MWLAILITMNSHHTQALKAELFHRLHHSGDLLIFPNIWDSLGTRLLESNHYPAIATASASIAYTHGFQDGENMPLAQLLELLTTITQSVNLPVTADIESGYATTNKQLEENIKAFIATGIVGINIEDTEKDKNQLYAIEHQCERIQIVRKVANELGIPLFINARTDVFIQDTHEAIETKLEEAIRRGLAYKQAGADGIFPIALRQQAAIETLVKQLQLPINILALPGIPDFETLKKIGVTRISLGPGFLKIAIQAMKNLAVALKNEDGLTAITENEITSDYLKNLVNK